LLAVWWPHPPDGRWLLVVVVRRLVLSVSTSGAVIGSAAGWLPAGVVTPTPLERAVTGWPVVVVRAEGGVVSALCLLGSG
jgi:hypothetical protein